MCMEIFVNLYFQSVCYETVFELILSKMFEFFIVSSCNAEVKV